MCDQFQSTRAFDRDSLQWFANRADPVATLNGRWAPTPWPQLLTHLKELFGLDRREHFLSQPPGVLPQLWERQITQGLRAVLLKTPHRTLERCQALFDAVAGPSACRLANIEKVTADDSTRMDLAIYAHTISGQECCLVLEAKLEAPLSENQLRGYKDRVRKRYPKQGQRHLWVVAPCMNAGLSAVLSQRENREWCFITWRRLLLNWQKALPVDMGSDALSFFNEIWTRVGGR